MKKCGLFGPILVAMMNGNISVNEQEAVDIFQEQDFDCRTYGHSDAYNDNQG